MPEEKCFSIHTEERHVQDNDVGENHKWGFQITGGADFGMPITIFQVSHFGDKRRSFAWINYEEIIKEDAIALLGMFYHSVEKRKEYLLMGICISFQHKHCQMNIYNMGGEICLCCDHLSYCRQF